MIGLKFWSTPFFSSLPTIKVWAKAGIHAEQTRPAASTAAIKIDERILPSILPRRIAPAPRCCPDRVLPASEARRVGRSWSDANDDLGDCAVLVHHRAMSGIAILKLQRAGFTEQQVEALAEYFDSRTATKVVVIEPSGELSDQAP